MSPVASRSTSRLQTFSLFVTAEPYIGHMGLAGVGKSRRLMEDEFAEHSIKPICNIAIKDVQPGKMLLEDGQEVPFRYSMMIPPFAGVDAVAGTSGLCNPKGFVNIDAYQANPKYRNIYAVGVCVAIPPVEQTPIPTGAPKTGYMIESMVSAAVHNIKAEIDNSQKKDTATWNAICLADMGDTGMAFVALPQMAPRNVTWARKGKWVHLAKIALEKYFLMKMKRGISEPYFEKAILRAIGITKLEKAEARAFAHFWGKSMTELRQMSTDELQVITHEFRDLSISIPALSIRLLSTMISWPFGARARTFLSTRLEQTIREASPIILSRLSFSAPQPVITRRCFNPAQTSKSPVAGH